MKSLVKMRLESVFWTLTSQKGHRQKQQRQYSLGQSGDSGQNSLCQPSKQKLNTYKRKSKQFLFLYVIHFNFGVIVWAYFLLSKRN